MKASLLTYLQEHELQFFSTEELGRVFYERIFKEYLSLFHEITAVLRSLTEERHIQGFIRERGSLNSSGHAEETTTYYWGYIQDKKGASLEEVYAYIQSHEWCTLEDITLHLYGVSGKGAVRRSSAYKKTCAKVKTLRRDNRIHFTGGKGRHPARYHVVVPAEEEDADDDDAA